jgi:small subunit ribosomal protein S1
MGRVVQTGHKGSAIALVEWRDGELVDVGFEGFVSGLHRPRSIKYNLYCPEDDDADANPDHDGKAAQRYRDPEGVPANLYLGQVRAFKITAIADTFVRERSFLASARSLDAGMMYRRAQQIREVCYKDREVIQGTIVAHNSGGLLVKSCGLSVFVPGSKSGYRDPIVRVKEIPVGSSTELVIADADVKKGRVVGSRDEVSENRACAKIRVGGLVKGHVRRLESYGAYVGIDDTRISGLLHVKNVSRRYLGAMEDLFQVGDPVKAIVMSMDPGFRNISLSTAELEEYPGQVQDDKELVFENAKEQAKQFEEFLRDFEEGGGGAGEDEKEMLS